MEIGNKNVLSDFNASVIERQKADIASNMPIRKLDQNERDIFGAAIFRASTMVPAFRPALALLRPLVDASAETAYTDENARVGLSYWFFYGTSGDYERATILLHESLHVLNGHFARARHLGLGPKMMNVAGDLEINTTLLTVDNARLDVGILPSHFKFDDKKTMDQYHIMLDAELKRREQEEKDKQGQQGSSQSQSGQGQSQQGQGSQQGQSQQGQGSSQSGQGGSQSGSQGQGQNQQGQGGKDRTATTESGNTVESGNTPAERHLWDSLTGDKSAPQGDPSIDGIMDDLAKEGKGATVGDNQAQGQGAGEGQGEGQGGQAQSRGEYDPNTGNGSLNGSMNRGRKKSRKIGCDPMTPRRRRQIEEAGIEGATSSEQTIARSNTSANIREELAKSVSIGSGSMNDFLRITLDRLSESRVDWRSALRRIVANHFNDVKLGTTRSTYTRVNRRWSTNGIFLPGRVDSNPKIMMGIDTSGSMSSNDYRAAMAEVEGIIKVAGRSTRGKLEVFSVDATVQQTQKVSSIKEINFYGGGGTDMSVAFQYVNALPARTRPDLFVLATDGGTDWGSILRELSTATYRSIILITTPDFIKNGWISEKVLSEVRQHATIIDISEDIKDRD